MKENERSKLPDGKKKRTGYALRHLLTLLLFLLIAACAPLPAKAKTATKTLYVSGTQDYAFAQSIVKRINKERTKRGLSRVTMDQSLTSSSIQRAAELCIYIPETSPHRRPNGALSSSVNKNFMYEICAEGYNTTAKQVVSGWMGSSAHKKGILLSNAKSVGVGCFRIDDAIYVCVNFSSSKASKRVTTTTEKKVVRKVKALGKYLKSSCFSLSGWEDLLVGEKETYTMMFQGKTSYNSQLPAVPLDPKTCKWSSSNPAVASISKKGIVTAKAAGSCKITATLKSNPKIKKKIKVVVEAETTD